MSHGIVVEVRRRDGAEVLGLLTDPGKQEDRFW